jgi:hypothetical protein
MTQSLASHRRIYPAFHFVAIPILITNLMLTVYWVVKSPSLATGWAVVLGIALLIVAFLTRINPIKVQDRLIRLEERLRLAVLLPGPLRSRIPELTEDQLAGLRFAADGEIPVLVERTLAEKLNRKAIKQAIQVWRPDYWRV